MKELVKLKHVERQFRGDNNDLYLTHKAYENGHQNIVVGYGKIPLFSVSNEKAEPVIKLNDRACEFIATNPEREAIYARVKKPFSLNNIFEETFAKMTELFQCNSFEIERLAETMQDPEKGPLVEALIQNMEAGFKQYKDSFTNYEQGYASLTA